MSTLRRTSVWLERATGVVVAVVVAGCASPSLPQGDPAAPGPSTSAPSTTVVDGSEGSDLVTPTTTGDDDASRRDTALTVDLETTGRLIDYRVFGTNVPAWIGPERLTNRSFIDETIASGVTLLRMPGGSWSNSYNWSACEVRDEQDCFWTWAASPSDFIDFMQATELGGIWTVSINETAQSAAAAVAFFNGELGDDTRIGLDRNGVDWGTVDRWARLRADGGNREPIDMHLWEVGNEVYGGRPGSGGEQCADFGWEDVWTCDGIEYVEGVARYDGYLTIREAMLEVDPTIVVGAVGLGDPTAWTEWGNEVVETAGDALDFYVVHEYGFDQPAGGDEVIRRPGALWPGVFDRLEPLLDGVPIAVTEYNMISFEAADTDRTMTKAMNALYTADTLGLFVSNGVPIANHWNLANGTTTSGSDYGLIRAEDFQRLPTFDAFRLWSRAGPELLDVTGSSEPDDLHLYATRHADSSLTMIAVNLGGPVSATIVLDGLDGSDLRASASMTGVTTDDLDAESLAEFADDGIAIVDEELAVDLPAWSITAIEVQPGG